MRVFPSAVIVLTTLIAGCAGGPGQPANERLETSTGADGRKHFIYRAEIPRFHRIGRPGGPPPTVNGETREKPISTLEREAMRNQLKIDIYTAFQTRIEESAFCPNGYSSGPVQLGPEAVIEGYCVEPQ